ncbi:hypothetical protein C9374_000205 [Naegleria lovaniensis]|uniref:Katanin p60 ATPase-containing subunit A-like 2 n=1 Tax=Naegleria lovaniensis TaxID=51637 RepID=A0AA88KPM8_NAELO|nr:uncharacterized protein C9374_000205 [Naegleria lovaniensis]KAG2388766.1 hypothetical protein C9374_000205 [Naegleria lovaniensis]
MIRYLFDNGYLESAEKMQSETGISLKKFDTADNMDLNTVLIEFEEYYQMKFMKKPKLFRKIQSGDETTEYGRVPPSKSPSTSPPSNIPTTSKPTSSIPQSTKTEQPPTSKGVVATKSALASTRSNKPNQQPVQGNTNTKTTQQKEENKENMAIDVSGRKIENKPILKKAVLENDDSDDSDEDFFEDRLLKPLPENLFFGDMRELAESIRREIIVSNPMVHWNDISGLSYAKQMVKEAVVMPLKYPQFFTGLLTPWKGALLFGPPGTGKTMLAKAVATECKTTFFNISASSIVSKWRGDSEKLVRVLFQLARHHAPSTIFLDELDSIMSQRVSATEHEGSRRMKTELLIQMDGLSKSNDLVFVLAASNLPWDLDQAVLRRLEKKILVGLPDRESRKSIFKKCLTSDRAELNENDYDTLAEMTEGYSGSDITLACKESAMIPVRKIFKQLEQLESQTANNATQGKRDMTAKPQELPPMDKVKMKDIESSLNIIKPSGNTYEKHYADWQQKYGI